MGDTSPTNSGSAAGGDLIAHLASKMVSPGASNSSARVFLEGHDSWTAVRKLRWILQPTQVSRVPIFGHPRVSEIRGLQATWKFGQMSQPSQKLKKMF